jgi:hypothetical protein
VGMDRLGDDFLKLAKDDRPNIIKLEEVGHA